MKRVLLYTSPGCCLCDKARALIEKVGRDIPLLLEEVDIRQDEHLYDAYRCCIPVVAIDGQVVLRGKVAEFWLRRALRGESIRKE